ASTLEVPAIPSSVATTVTKAMPILPLSFIVALLFLPFYRFSWGNRSRRAFAELRNLRPGTHSPSFSEAIQAANLTMGEVCWQWCLINASALPDAHSRCGVGGGEELLARPVKPF